MAGVLTNRKSLISTLLVLLLVFGLLYAGNTVDLLSGITRPLVTEGLRLVGVDAQDGETHLTAGHLRIPWTGDCAGLNLLAILVAVTFWSQRGRPMGVGFWLRLLAAFPLAFVANLLRIFTLIGLRWLLYPTVESPQLHYFIGFLWVLPFLSLLLRRPDGTSASFFWLEILRIAALLSLLAPFINAPGGAIVALCTLLLLARYSWHPPTGWLQTIFYAAWLLGAFVVSVSRMESLWIPWLLTCPGFLRWTWSRMGSLALLLPGTIPLVAMQPWSWVILLPGAGWEIYQTWRQPGAPGEPTRISPAIFAVTAFFHLFPFLAGMAAAMTGGGGFPPPAGVMSHQTPEKFFLVRQVGQPGDLHCFWYEPDEGGRHHTLEVCLQYRGVTVGRSPVDGVQDDGTNWLMEFFLMPDGELLDYAGYLRATFWPFSANGAHVIYAAPSGLYSAEEFARAAEKNARALAEMIRSRDP